MTMKVLPPAAGPEENGKLVIVGEPFSGVESDDPPGLPSTSVASQDAPAGMVNDTKLGEM